MAESLAIVAGLWAQPSVTGNRVQDYGTLKSCLELDCRC